MKKRIMFSMALLFGVTSIVNAQSIVGGLKVTPSFALVKDNSPVINGSGSKVPVSSGIGYGFGYYEILDFKKHLDLQGEINFSVNNYRQIIESPGGFSQVNKWSLSYIDVPLLARIKFDNFGIGIGPMHRFAIGGVKKTEDINPTETTITDEKIKGSSETALVLDFSYKIKKVYLGLRFASGTKNTLETGNPSRILSFSFGYTIF
jgi:hypothetical protein